MGVDVRTKKVITAPTLVKSIPDTKGMPSKMTILIGVFASVATPATGVSVSIDKFAFVPATPCFAAVNNIPLFTTPPINTPRCPMELIATGIISL